MKPNTPEKATGDWKQLAEESLENYVRKHCAEGVLVQAVHDNILRLEVAIQFSGQGRCKKFLRESLRNRILRKSLPGSPDDWDVTSKYLSQAEGARHAIYENLRARTVPPMLGGWRLVLDRAPRAQLPASLIASAPGPAGGVTISGGAGGAGGGRAGSGICARPAAGDGAKFFSVTITVKQAEPCGGDRSWIDKITGAVEKHVSRNSAEALLVQSVAGGCLTLNGAMRFNAPRNRNDLQTHLRARQVMTLVPPGVGDGDVTCTVSARSEDERHAVYETLRRMAAAAGPGEAGQAQPGPPATRTLVVVDSVLAAPGRSAAVAAVAPRDSAEVGPLCGQNRSAFIRVVVRVDACHSSIVESPGLEAGPSSCSVMRRHGAQQPRWRRLGVRKARRAALTNLSLGPTVRARGRKRRNPSCG